MEAQKLECLKLASARYSDADEIVAAAEKYWQWLAKPTVAETVWREDRLKRFGPVAWEYPR